MKKFIIFISIIILIQLVTCNKTDLQKHQNLNNESNQTATSINLQNVSSQTATNISCIYDDKCIRQSTFYVFYLDQCICWLGYTRNPLNQCIQTKCVLTSQCTATFNQTECVSGKCICDSNHIINQASQICDLIPPRSYRDLIFLLLIIPGVTIPIILFIYFIIRRKRRQQSRR